MCEQVVLDRIAKYPESAKSVLYDMFI